MVAQELFTTPLFSDANLVSYWRMEGNSNDAKSSNNGTDTSITYSSGNGKFGQGAGFNGTSSLSAVADNANLRITGALTLHAWVKTNDAGAALGMTVFNKGNQSNAASEDYLMGINGRKIAAYVSDGSTPIQFNGNSTMSDAAWHMIDMVYIPSTSVTLYLDGVQDRQIASGINASIQSTTHACGIGRDGTNAAGFFNGDIDELAIFNRALTTTEISNLFNGFPATTNGAFLLNFT